MKINYNYYQGGGLRIHLGVKNHKAKCGIRLRLDLVGSRDIKDVTCKRCISGNGNRGRK